ncbi:MAG: ACT domain-containing protein [Syntrophaceae bacterium]|nr:ACT domain-containing protein [Syntrophaceae bacterium]HOE80583.1 ACT domain-containing protein [Smithellaceae bacterium]HQF84026.1 ACT domain-containing protein [Smithellaceae bacterium]HQG80335.1 ACT domain-containing protein [Smithellaceae bacterium]
MIAYQLSVHAENKPGQLAGVTALLARAGISIRATTITTFGETGIINLIVDEPKRAEKVLIQAGKTVYLKDVLAVLIPDRPGGLDRLMQLLYQEGININNAYGFVLECGEKAVFVVDVDRIEKTEKLLEKNKFETLDTEALSAVEPFHYMKY